MVEVAVTGIGAVCAAANGADGLFRALENPKRIFGQSRYQLDVDVVVGEAKEQWFAKHDSPELESPTGSLCLTAARECVAQAESRGLASPDGLVLGTSTGGQGMNEEVVFGLLEGREPQGFSYRRQGCMAAPTRLVARDLDIRGPVQTVSTACTSSANAIALGASWIESGRCEAVIAGGGDALCNTTICSFKALELTGPDMCTPFGENRPGLTLGEGAGFLMLERLDRVLERGAAPLALLRGYGMSSDAHHMTAPPEDGRGAKEAMKAALDKAGLEPKDVHLVNAHGTGTQLNDAAEANAVSDLFGERAPVFSCKGLLGHTLGGAGGLEAVASVFCVVHRRGFENLGASQPAQECPVSLVQPGGLDLPEKPVVLSNSFAFGGNNCSLVFGAHGEEP